MMCITHGCSRLKKYNGRDCSMGWIKMLVPLSLRLFYHLAMLTTSGRIPKDTYAIDRFKKLNLEYLFELDTVCTVQGEMG